MKAGPPVYSASRIDPAMNFRFDGGETLRHLHQPRRLQDPLAELVKIVQNPSVSANTSTMSNQKKLSEGLDFVVDTVVNQVGGNVNTANSALLSISLVSTRPFQKNIVKYREEKGALKTREQLKEVPRLGDREGL